jgi:hypothetical protein
MNSATYLGIKIVASGTNINVYDGTQSLSSNNIMINYQDLIGQPVWTNINTMQFKTTLRGDIKCGTIVTMPSTLASLSSTAAFSTTNSQNLQGSFLITRLRHTGNFRQPDWQSWCTTFDGLLSNNGVVTLDNGSASQADIN